MLLISHRIERWLSIPSSERILKIDNYSIPLWECVIWIVAYLHLKMTSQEYFLANSFAASARNYETSNNFPKCKCLLAKVNGEAIFFWRDTFRHIQVMLEKQANSNWSIIRRNGTKIFTLSCFRIHWMRERTKLCTPVQMHGLLMRHTSTFGLRARLFGTPPANLVHS